MAIPSWITLNKKSGTGDDTVTVSASPNHTGAQRSTTLTFTGGGITKTVSVTQDYNKNVDVNLNTACTLPTLGRFNAQYVSVYLLYRNGKLGNPQRSLLKTLEYTGQESGSMLLQGDCSIANTEGISILGFSVYVSQAGTGASNFSTVAWRFNWFYDGTLYKFSNDAKTLVWSGTRSDVLDFYFQDNSTIDIPAGQAETLNLSSSDGLVLT